jgi:hypothetical protein
MLAYTLFISPWQLSQLNHQSKRLVYSLITWKSLGDIAVQENQIRAFPKTGSIFTLYAALEKFTEIVLWTKNVRFFGFGFFFIYLSLRTVKLPCIDNPDSLPSVGVADHQQPAVPG